MISKKLFIIASVLILAAVIGAITVWHYCTKNEAVSNSMISRFDELNSYRTSFITNLENTNLKLKNITVKDSLNKKIDLIDCLKKNKKTVLLCRFSETHCESCVNYAIQSLLQHANIIETDNIIFLGNYKNNRLFNKQKTLYGIDAMDVYNVSSLDIPAEEIGYPYYLICDDALKIINITVPDKNAPKANELFFKLIVEKIINK